MKTTAKLHLLALAAACAGAPAMAAAPDWSKVPGTKITVFYPGVTPIEWVMKGTEHGGARLVRKGESCASCHNDEAADMGKKMASGQKLEPAVIKGKAGAIPVTVQAANDGANLYLRFSWKQPSGGADKMDKDNQVKLSVMLEDNKIPNANLSGCWEACHVDARTMPDAKGVKHDGYIAETRVMDGGKALVDAKGENKGGEWSVVFTRKFAGGEGDITLAPGKTYNLGFAIHDDWTAGRFHQVSLGYSLGIDTKADISAAKQ